jgi:transcriptional regulator with XRE-family HTH domain
MNRKEFGELIAALREDLGRTQAGLAELVEVDDSTISNIERGAKKHIDPQLLCDLAQALRLTRGERQQLYLAASGLDEEQIMRPAESFGAVRTMEAQQALDQTIEQMARMRIPCSIVDVYQDNLAANGIMFDLFAFPAERIEALRRVPAGLSSLWSLYSTASPLGATVNEGWEQFALNTMRAFRENSLRYRTRPYYKYLMKEFRTPGKYPSFERYWRLASTLEPEAGASVRQYAFTHPEHGRLEYYTARSFTTTAHGELFFYQLVPSDGHTTQVFEEIARRVGARAYRLASWPHKVMV